MIGRSPIIWRVWQSAMQCSSTIVKRNDEQDGGASVLFALAGALDLGCGNGRGWMAWLCKDNDSTCTVDLATAVRQDCLL